MDYSSFDAEELLHLAANLAGQGKSAEALSCLQQAAKLEPENAKVAYLMGATYMQTGMVARAIEMTRKAVQSDPGFDLAHFQLGLLLYTSDQESQAYQAWQPLDKLGDEHPLFLFKSGLIALEEEQFEECRSCLTKGIERNAGNEPLNQAMRQFVEWTHEAEKDSKAQEGVEAPIAFKTYASAGSKVPELPEMFRSKRP